MANSAAEPPRSVLVTGASSGLGRALGIALARRARAAGTPLRLWLTGRDAARLAETAERVAELAADVAIRALDVTTAAELQQWMLECDAAMPLDLVVANAGRSAGTADGPESAAQVRTLVETNVAGTINTVLPAAALMRTRRRGRIVIVASLAAWLPFPSTPTYSASKAFIRTWGLALRPDLAQDGVSLTIVSPGYIATPMTAANRFPMPFLLSAERAAAYILRRLDHGPAEIAFPFPAVCALRVVSLLPAGTVGRLMARAPRKRGLET